MKSTYLLTIFNIRWEKVSLKNAREDNNKSKNKYLRERKKLIRSKKKENLNIKKQH